MAGAWRGVRDVIRALRTIVEGGPPALETVLPALRELVRADAALGLALAPSGDRIGSVTASGDAALVADAQPVLEAMLRPPPRVPGAPPAPWPDPRERNVVLQGRGPGAADGLRVLVCDGGAPAAALAIMRRTPFEPHHRRALQRIVPALAHRLAVERLLERAPVVAAALTATLEAVRGPAFLLRERGHLVQANAAARALLARDPHGVAVDLRAAAAGRGDPRFSVTRLEVPNAPDHFLAVLRPAPGTPTPRAAAAAVRWRLTPRQREVLGQLAAGKGNKDIAARLGLAERTVELHVTALLEKMACEHRAQLVARFWTEL
jgi:DNA-binding CsgD family transcriptional regulator